MSGYRILLLTAATAVWAGSWERMRDPEISSVVIPQSFSNCDDACDARRANVEAAVELLVDTDGSSKELKLVLLDLDRNTEEVYGIERAAIRNEKTAIKDPDVFYFLPSAKYSEVQQRPRKFVGKLTPANAAKFLSSQLEQLLIPCSSLDDCQQQIDNRGGVGFIGQFATLDGEGAKIFEQSALQMRISGQPILFAITSAVGAKQKLVDEEKLGRVSILHPGEWRLVLNLESKAELDAWMETESFALYAKIDDNYVANSNKPDWLFLVGPESSVGTLAIIEEMRGVALPLRDEFNIGWTDDHDLATKLAEHNVEPDSVVLIRQGQVFVQKIKLPFDEEDVQNFMVDCAHKKYHPMHAISSQWEINRQRLIKDIYPHNFVSMLDATNSPRMVLLYNPRSESSNRLLKDFENAAKVFVAEDYGVECFKLSVLGVPKAGSIDLAVEKAPFILFKESKQSLPRKLELPSQNRLDAIIQQAEDMSKHKRRRDILAEIGATPQNVTQVAQNQLQEASTIVRQVISTVSSNIPKIRPKTVMNQVGKAFGYLKGLVSDEL